MGRGPLGDRRSVSGHERNHLFLSNQGTQFEDLSGISGLDHDGDSRSFGLLDYDRDGWQDIALVNANAPLLQLFRNQLGDDPESADRGRSLAFRLVGGNHAAAPSAEWSNRDGYGAQVSVTLDDKTLVRELRCGEGFAAQNSTTMIVGIGTDEAAESISVRWPSGKVQTASDIPAGTLVSVYENPLQSSTGEAFVMERYRAAAPKRPSTLVGRDQFERLTLLDEARESEPPGLRMYITMATWCPSCKGWLPHVKKLSSVFSSSELEIYGVPVDEEEGLDKLQAYVETNQPAYELLTALPADKIASVKTLVTAAMGQEILPATILTNGDGRILMTTAGVPSVSELRRLLPRASSADSP